MKTSSLALILTLTGALTTLADSPLINNISVRQRWPWSKKVDISFVVGATNVPQDAIFTAYNGATELGVIPDAALVGDHYGLPTAGGKCSVVFDPAKSGFSTDVIKDFRVEVTTAESTTATNILYKIINLSDSSSYPVTDVTEADIVNNKYGSWQRTPVSGVDSIIWTAVTNVDVWATTNLVLRHIPAGSFYMGYFTNNPTSGFTYHPRTEAYHVTISKDYYIGVFEITQKQWELVRPEKAGISYFTNKLYAATRPLEQVPVAYIRGNYENNAANWPVNTNTTGFVDNLNKRTGQPYFDVPTEAQWEYACRAGTETELNSGKPITEANLAEVARVGANYATAKVGADLSNGTMTVGRYRPNAWGLYDMHGNVYELCRDWFIATGSNPASVNTPVTTDPTGPASNSEYKRLVRGGWWASGSSSILPARSALLATWNTDMENKANRGIGFRVMLEPAR